MEEQLISCPGCDLKLSELYSIEQVKHMRENHPEIIIARLREAGMNYEADKLESEK